MHSSGLLQSLYKHFHAKYVVLQYEFFKIVIIC